MQQLNIFTDPAEVPSKKLSRTSDPITSKLSAEKVKDFSKSFQVAILNELKKGRGTYEELAERTGLRPDQVWRRLSDLQKNGLAAPCNDFKPGSSGRLQRIWEAT
jgi:predicted ArsR family transcriptional regulator